MKKYKHKTTGVVVTQHFYKETKVYPEHYDYEYKRSETAAIHSSIDAMFVENSNDWEEVITSTNLNMQFIDTMVKEAPWIQQLGRGYRAKEEPNYLITAFEGNKSDIKFQLQSNGRYKDSGIGAYFDKDFLLNNTTIFSIKNEFGKEFSIGDKVRGDNEEFTIESFQLGSHILGGCYACGTDKLGNVKVSIKLLNVVKTLLHTTTDGVEIMEGDEITLTLIDKNNFARVHNGVYIKNFIKEEVEICNRYLTFTSEENRDKYIKENTKKPIFVSADGKEMFEGDNFYLINATCFEFRDINMTYDGNDNYLKFSSKEVAQEYINNNKPKYSLIDIENAYCKAMNDEFDGLVDIIEELRKLGK